MTDTEIVNALEKFLMDHRIACDKAKPELTSKIMIIPFIGFVGVTPINYFTNVKEFYIGDSLREVVRKYIKKEQG